MKLLIPKNKLKINRKLKVTFKSIESSYDIIQNDLLCNNCSNNNGEIPKTTWKLQIYLQLVLHRTTDILTDISWCLENDILSSSSILIRALFENITILYDSMISIEDAIAEENIESVNEHLNRMILRTNNDPDSPYQAERVEDICDRIAVEYPSYRSAFDSLSELSHPNYDGMIGLYCKEIFLKKKLIDIIKSRKLKHDYMYSVKVSKVFGFKKDVFSPLIIRLNASLLMLIVSYKRYTEMYDRITLLSNKMKKGAK